MVRTLSTLLVSSSIFSLSCFSSRWAMWSKAFSSSGQEETFLSNEGLASFCEARALDDPCW